MVHLRFLGRGTAATLAALLTVSVGTARAEVVRFSTRDGVQIVADYIAPSRADAPVPAVILLHIYGSNRASWGPLIPRLTEAGMAVLAIDMRGHGESIEPRAKNLAQRMRSRDAKLFNNMYQDVAAAVAFLGTRDGVDMSRLALVGASVGCSVALDYAARDPSIDVVVCMTPGTNYLGLDSTGPIKKLGDRRVLLLATEGERKASDALKKLNPHVTARVVGAGVTHGTRMFGKIDGIERSIVGFLRSGIGAPTDAPVYGTYPEGKRYYLTPEAAMKAAGVRGDALREYSSEKEAQQRGLSKAE